MHIAEPVTLFTDYILGVVAVIFAALLFRDASTRGQKSLRYWALAFTATAVAAFIGGTYHGFHVVLGEHVSERVWQLTLYATGFTSLFFLIGGALSILPKIFHRLIVGFALTKFTLFLALVSMTHEFRFVIYDYGLSMILLVAMCVYSAYRHEATQGAQWIIAGVLVSFFASAIQLSGYDIHQNFNHNDLYHVIQIVTLYLFYAGAKALNSPFHERA